MIFPIILDSFSVPVRPWDLWLEQKVAISREVLNLETKQTMTIEEMIVHYAEKNWAPVKLAKKIAFCESRYNPKVKNKNSSAWGVFQFINKTWDHNSRYYWRPWESKYNADANIDVATKKIAREWTHARLQSYGCWWKEK